MECRWIKPKPANDVLIRRVAGELEIPVALAEVLVGRGLEDSVAAGRYFDPKLRELSAPEELDGIVEAVARVDKALRDHEHIVLYGDYDVDGVTSLAFLSRVLRAFGGRVDCFLPVRAEEGYGLSPEGVERCFSQCRPDLMIAVDCGTNSVREAAMLRERGVDMIILDHHEPSGERPQAIVVNPKVSGSPLRYLCSAGVVFKLVHALFKKSPHPELDLRDYLDLVAMATVADMVPLEGENRILVRRGLLQLSKSRWPGLRALMHSADVGNRPRGSDIGFRLGPRINASGRLGTALESLKLLTTEDEQEARVLAAGLERQNRERQGVERSVAAEADDWVAKCFDPGRDASIVAGARDWHQGVLGIVASRIMRKYHRPTIVIGFGENGMGKGSGRSVEGFSLVEALTSCAGLLEKFGGHELAAGLSIREEQFEEFRGEFEKFAQSASDAEMLTPRLRLDATLALADIDEDFLDAQDRLEPFGNGNSQPVFFAQGVRPAAAARVLKEKHLRLEFGESRLRMAAIYFNGAEYPLPSPPWDVAFRVERNTYQGRDEPQMQIVAIRAGE